MMWWKKRFVHTHTHTHSHTLTHTHIHTPDPSAAGFEESNGATALHAAVENGHTEVRSMCSDLYPHSKIAVTAQGTLHSPLHSPHASPATATRSPPPQKKKKGCARAAAERGTADGQHARRDAAVDGGGLQPPRHCVAADCSRWRRQRTHAAHGGHGASQSNCNVCTGVCVWYTCICVSMSVSV